MLNLDIMCICWIPLDVPIKIHKDRGQGEHPTDDPSGDPTDKAKFRGGAGEWNRRELTRQSRLHDAHVAPRLTSAEKMIYTVDH